MMRELLWNAISYAVVAGAGIVLLAGLWLFVPMARRRWLPLERFPPGRWTGHEVFLATCVILGFPDLVRWFLIQMGFFVALIGPPPQETAPELERIVHAVRCGYLSTPITLAFLL